MCHIRGDRKECRRLLSAALGLVCSRGRKVVVPVFSPEVLLRKPSPLLLKDSAVPGFLCRYQILQTCLKVAAQEPHGLLADFVWVLRLFS